jgi:U32 family peptidase
VTPAAPARGREVFELTTTVSNLRHLRASDLTPYDAIYLGNVYCRLYEGNLLEHPADIREAVHIVRDRGLRAYLTTYAALREDAVPVVRRALETGFAAGAAAVEVHALGLVKLVRDEFPGLAIHAGTFANVYTDLGVDVLRAFGVCRIAPGYELGLDEVDAIVRGTTVPLELTIHGKIPLGVSEVCALLPYEATWGVRCPDLCQKPVVLEKDGWALRSVGKGVLSGRDVCLLEHLGRLVAAGHRHFRIEAASETPAYRLAIGAVYREALARALSGAPGVEAWWWEAVQAHAPLGLCNGFYFGRSGMDYVGAVEGGPSSPPTALPAKPGRAPFSDRIGPASLPEA